MVSVTALLLLAVTVAAVDRPNVLGYTDTVRLERQGPLKGLLTTVTGPGGHLDQVEVYLGVPYASQERFMPPGEPPAWCSTPSGSDGHGHSHCRPLLAEYLKPVCPQKLPEIGDSATGTNKRMSAIRMNYLKRLMPYLGNQSEDCLYLNIYAPHDSKSEVSDENEFSKPIKKSKYAVIMFIHGESFEWNSGNPYDGSILSSFGKIIFITINYRVGVLGFLKSNSGDNPASNFGLLDQVAALEWIKNNIQAFGGNPNAVTVMGHGNGAACTNFLMMSPPVNNNDLFQRAILMSGSALSDWALVKNPIVNTIQVGQSLNCEAGEDEIFFDCLRKKRFTDLISAKVYAPSFSTKFGPMVDGVMVTNEPLLLLKEHKSLMRRYNVLMGVTEYESYHLLDSISLIHGMLENEQQSMLLDYMKAKFELFPDLTLRATLAQYTDRDRSWSTSGAFENRDILLDILSDAMVVAPLTYLADIQSEVNEHTYFYVFTHRSSFNEYDTVKKSINGEDLPYVLGVPLGGNTINLKTQFDQKEKRLSEMMMTYWSNFAKTGDPSFSKKSTQNEWKINNIRWPKYNTLNHAYFELTRARVNYRTIKSKFWNLDLPQKIEDKKQKEAEQSKPPLPEIFQPPWSNHETPMFIFPTMIPEYTYQSSEYPQEPNTGEELSSEPSDKNTPVIEEASSPVVIPLIIIIGICFLLVNICAFGGIYYQRDKLRVRERLFNNRFRCNEANTSRSYDDDLDDMYVKAEVPQLENIQKFGKSDVYDSVALASVKPEAMGGKRLGKWAEISKHRSSSTVTMDPHTRVKEWINTEIIQRYSPKILRRQKREEKKRQLVCAEDPVETIVKIPLENTNFNQPRNKVSVAIDATPAARTISVLKQTPIELTKSMDMMNSSEKIDIKPSLSLSSIDRNPLTRGKAMNESDILLSSTDTLHKSSTSIQLKPAAKEKKPGIVVVHSYSKSESSRESNKEPVYTQVCKPKEKLSVSKNPSFESSTHYEDINVTSKEFAVNEGSSLSVDSSRRLKYPKVLPDFPNERNSTTADRRLSLPPPAFASIPEGSSVKIPPPPPPRISSTLGRKKDLKSEVTILFNKTRQEVIPEEHKSLIVPSVPNVICPLTAKSGTSRSVNRKLEPRIVIKAGSTQNQPKRVNIPRVIHPQNSDKNKCTGENGNTGTIKRKKK
ncbi:neuroligin-4, X-linked-like isoform X2 [Daktulosphaira vitifoliae]|uniref:neuroligin-4, X-linked-like isoform X2 n=1 Tax=Daktulosphaira vitifoliae TaxID=58002 RepID=UPI0021AA46B7|nr:neuroligin-4, X-linked-like isoform X2 [Daktulosphaira vitifoliae]